MIGVDHSFWSGKSVFVTGHTGFKGGWLTTWLANMGAEVTGYALEPGTTPSYFQLCQLKGKLRSVIADIRDQNSLATAIADARPEIVFHLAAQPLVHRSYRDPLETLNTNIIGTANLLEAVRATPSIAAVIVATSDKCYANQEWLWGYRETDPLGGHDPYSASKACAELVCAAYRQSFFASGERRVALSTVRAGNVIGGGDWSADRLVPDAIKAFAAGETLRVRNPGAVRPWQHVLEPVSGYLRLAERMLCDPAKYTGSWNFGPADNSMATVAVLADALAKRWGEAKWRAAPAESFLFETSILKLDCSKARALLQWRTCLSLVQAATMTVDWYRKALTCVDGGMHAFSTHQILQYQEHGKQDEVH
ncbi:MAG: CDP-glucose 4,6-dehydratase [Candidatus Binataceae bacterium]|jgi:CDP-glucose 4,6-dehydratase